MSSSEALEMEAYSLEPPISIKSQRSGIRQQCDLEEPTASVMAIDREVVGEWVDGIKVEVGEKMNGLVLARPELL
mgnify:CR=1 FL=1